MQARKRNWLVRWLGLRLLGHVLGGSYSWLAGHLLGVDVTAPAFPATSWQLSRIGRLRWRAVCWLVIRHRWHVVTIRRLTGRLRRLGVTYPRKSP